MSLDEAIAREEALAYSFGERWKRLGEKIEDLPILEEEHRQMANWLKELKLYRKTEKYKWNNHQVACLLADIFGDTCACNYNGNDEWLPYKCELLDVCPNTVGVACWEQYLAHREVNANDGDCD